MNNSHLSGRQINNSLCTLMRAKIYFNKFTQQIINWKFVSSGKKRPRTGKKGILLCNQPREKIYYISLLQLIIALVILKSVMQMSISKMIYLNVSISDFKSFGSIVVFPNINQHLCTKSAKYFRVSCGIEKFQEKLKAS